MTGKRKRRGITPWKKTALKVCVLWLIAAAGIHGYRELKALGFEDQREASRWGAPDSCAQISAFLPREEALMEENIKDLEYKINTTLAQDSIKKTSEGKDSKLWQDCYSGIGELKLAAGSKTVTVEAVGTGGAFFTFHPLKLSAGSYYLSDSVMKDEILLDEETAWKLFGSFDVEGRTVRVDDMHLRIAGVYKKGEGTLYDEGGLSDYVVFVQYKTLLKYGGSGNGYDGGSQQIPNTASRPAGYAAVARAADTSEEEPKEAGESAGDSQEADDTAGDTNKTDNSAGSTEAGSGGRSSGSGDANSTVPDDTQNMENVGTGNTHYKDTGMITTYEIVMPDPVEGYAAAAVKKAFGDDTGVIVVDNTNRYRIPNLYKDLRNFALLGMRTRAVRYPYWENVALGWETIFAALFLLECILIALTILLILWMIIHWYRNRSWTLAGSVRNLQDSVYERQSMKKYPEYYMEREQDSEEETPQREKARASERKDDKPSESEPEKGMLEDKGLAPFETIRDNRKAVQYETKHQDDQRDDGNSAHSDHDGMRQGRQ